MSALDRALAKAYGSGRLLFEPAAPSSPPAPRSLSVYREEPADPEAAEVLPPAVPLAALARRRVVGEPFRPLLQVDRFAWPDVCEQLLREAAGLFDRFTGELVGRARNGQKVAGLAGCGVGHGCTTVVLCVARQLAEQGVRCAVVDANLRRAVLARTLGIAAQGGWEDALSGESTLAEVSIESLVDKLALVPRRETTERGERPAATLRSVATFRMLRDGVGLVLVDCGAADDDGLADVAACGAALGVSHAYLIFDRRGGGERVGEVSQRLRDAGVQVCGAVENFAVRCGSRPRLSVLQPASR